MADRGITLVAGGDVMLGEHPIMVGRGVGTAINRDPGFDPFAGIADVLGGADLAFANLECALEDPPRGASPEARECLGPARGVGLLQRAGFAALSVANNHIEQHGPEAVRRTLAALMDAGISPVGLAAEPGRCRPVDLERGGVPLRLLGYSLRPRQHFTHTPLYAEGTPEGMLADVAAAVAAGRTVVISVHWGDEFVPRPSRAQQELGRALVDEGAVLVLGHHPHVLQGWERRGRGVIVYSLGNLVFDMPWLPELRRTALFRCRLDASGVESCGWQPLLLDRRHRPQPAVGAEGETILGFLAEASSALESGEGPLAVGGDDEYAGAVRRGLAANRKASHAHFLRHAWRYEPRVLGSIVGKFVRRRLGLLKD